MDYILGYMFISLNSKDEWKYFVEFGFYLNLKYFTLNGFNVFKDRV